MTKQEQPARRGEQHRRGKLWQVLLPGTLLVAIIVVVAALRLLSSPPASPLPLREQASPSPARGSAHLERLSDLPLPGGPSRFDYQSVDPRTRLLFISHLGRAQ